ncbi:NADPH:quinone oxidoreductase family protein [Parvibaculum sp.]|uniref:quinone oxidoreductase family protein n=1 Tax=Parvibaculum sp. TaxID=2024848 RepID=UPI002C610C5D|nr:NADPH:quinone oxidoreductase family protein [Parvibaculum sp.]HUD51078.1 NADPH:quinone oxidoreductase family protein [Parvibaculum sp.]
MKAIRAERRGGPEVLAWVDLPVPEIDEHAVLVRFHAIGVNYADVLCREAAHPSMRPPPIVVGCEGAGVVVACGAAVREHRPGDRVGVYSPFGGAYAEWVSVPAHYALPLPETMSFEEAAAFTHVYLTGYHALRTLGHAESGDGLFISAAAGGLGTAILQLAKAWNLRMIAGIGSDEKREYVAKLGVEHVVNYRVEDVSARLAEITEGRGPDVVIETVGGELFWTLQQALAPLGRLVTVGVAGGIEPRPDVGTLLSKSASYAALNLSVIFARKPELIPPSWRDLCDLYMNGALPPVIGHRFRLDEAAMAHELLESRRSTGKIILLP